MRDEPRNVIMVTSDSIRADYCYTAFNDYETTPTLAELAAEGIKYDEVIAPGPRTPSSVPEMIAGDAVSYGSGIHSGEKRHRLIEDIVSNTETAPERLSNRGYQTVAVTANPYTSEGTGFADIFDEFYDEGAYQASTLQNAIPNSTVRTLVSLTRQYLKNMHWFLRWPAIYDDILEIVESLDRPYFVWIFLLDTHNPYIPPRADRHESTTVGIYRGVLYGNSVLNKTDQRSDTQTTYNQKLPESVEADIKCAYRDAIRSVDRFIGQLWKAVQSDDPVLIFNSDHGEAFGEHGSYGHESLLYEENVRVPFVVYNAGETASIETPISLRRIPDMLTEFVDEGTSFADDKWSEDVVFTSAEDGTVAARGRRWKYIRSGRDETLYDLRTDPGERFDISQERANVTSKLRRQTRDFLERARYGVEEKEKTIDDDLSDRLRSLGYVD